MHLQSAAGGLVGPVKVFSGVLDLGFDLIERSLGNFSQVFGHGSGGSGGGEIGYQCFRRLATALFAVLTTYLFFN